MATPAFANTLTNVEQLADHYRPPSQLVLDKDIDHIDANVRSFIAAATLCLVGTSQPDGRSDVSPKGGMPGFVHVLDHSRLVIPDLNGNNRLDSLRNIIVNPNVGLLFLVPERGETLRVNGRAHVSIDPDLLDGFADQYRRPVSVIGVEVSTAFLHCAKCIRRAGLWQPETWGSSEDVPPSAQIFADHLGLAPTDAEAFDEQLEAGYLEQLAADSP